MTDFPTTTTTTTLTETIARCVSEMLTPSEIQLREQNRTFIRSIREFTNLSKRSKNLKTVNVSLLR